MKRAMIRVNKVLPGGAKMIMQVHDSLIALLNEPPVILADEPTGNLDPITGESIVSQLHRIAANGTAVIMATHNMSLISRYPGRTLMCEHHTLSPFNPS